MEALYLQYQNYVHVTLGLLSAFMIGKLGTVRVFADSLYSEIRIIITWLARALSEPDGIGGKPSFTKILGTYVVLKIVWLAVEVVETKSTTPIPSELMTLFMFLIGYQIVSKVLLENPALMELIKGKYGVSKDEQKREA